MNTPANPSNVRLTITVSSEVHETFSRLAKAGGMSISRCMGEWLADTLDAATFMAEKMEQARAAPRLVAREMHAYALGLADETQQVLQKVRGGAGGAHGKRSATAAAAQPSPPSCNTGGKVTKPRGKGKAQ